MSTNVTGVGSASSQYGITREYEMIKADDTKVSESTKVGKHDYGKTIGKPQLSEKAAAYYDELKSKFGQLDFILVSKDQKENAKAMAGSYANPYRMVVLIDEEKIERMANDENYRAKYETMIAQAASGLKELKRQVEATGQSGNVKGYGLVANDNGVVTFFAALKKSSEAQRARIAAKQEEKREEAREAAREKTREANSEKLEKIGEARGEKTSEVNERTDMEEIDEDTVIITANSVEELMRKIEEYYQNDLMNNIRTEQELTVGQHIDFKG